jgi:hypothetical protein
MLTSKFVRPLVVAAFLFTLFVIFSLSSYPAATYAQIPDDISLLNLSFKDSSIPNIVHYVILKKDADSMLHLRFDHFLSIYASIMYFAPTAILLHTDHNASVIADAKANGNKWTKKILNLPSVKANLVVSPEFAEGTNKLIRKIEHKSDFVRITELHRTGGLYMDLDVLPLRDVRILRNAGYKTIVGRQLHGRINNGVIFAQKGAALTQLMQREGPQWFNGGWESHSIKLITPIAERLARFPGEVLIMDELAFSPTSWEEKSTDMLFGPHNDTSLSEEAGPQGLGDSEHDPIAWWDKKTERRRAWEMDFSQTYLLHAYKSRGHTVPGFKGITVEYVQRRDSNYALAAWPVVKHALENGVVEDGDDEA